MNLSAVVFMVMIALFMNVKMAVKVERERDVCVNGVFVC
jgi:hypothetical protein